MRTFACSLVALLALSHGFSTLAAEPKKPAPPAAGAPTLAKRGWIDDPKLKAAAPPSQVITSEKGLAALYKAWSLGDEVPKIDFAKELVIVVTDRSNGNMMAMTDSKGDLKIHFGGPPSDKPGFGYVLQTASREGVKTVNGKPLPKE